MISAVTILSGRWKEVCVVTRSFIAEDRPYPYVTQEELEAHTGGLIP